MSDLLATKPEVKVIAVVTCDFDRTAIGTRSRLRDPIANKPVLHHVLNRLLAVGGLNEIILATPTEQLPFAKEFAIDPRIHTMELLSRSQNIDARLRTGRAWNLQAWRGGAGQFTCFDEEYHPATIAKAVAETHADHVLTLHSHSLFLDVDITAALLHHHLHKNHEMRVTYTPSAPGLTGMFLRADIALEMGEKSYMPWQLLSYDPANPQFDTLIRDACMQVDPALSKIPNRFCVDTDRSMAFAQHWHSQQWHGRPAHVPNQTNPSTSSATLALAAAQTIAPGTRDFSHLAPAPRELEIELTGKRTTTPPGSVPLLLRESRGHLDPAHWHRWLAAQNFPDDLLLTFAGDGDPLLYGHLPQILRAAREANPLSICLQSDLALPEPAMQNLLTIIADGTIDVLTIPMYGHTESTYNHIANAPVHALVMKNLATLAAAMAASPPPRGTGIPLVIPRLLKLRDTIPEMELFFDTWLDRTGWALLESPTDRAGQLPTTAVVDMASPKRRPCRRLWDRLLLRANGTANACDQDMHDTLHLGHIESHSLPQLWNSPALTSLRQKHAEAKWNEITPCRTCKEWHRP